MKNNPTLLVAKGKFHSAHEESRNNLFMERDNMLRSGKSASDEDVVALTKQIMQLDSMSKQDKYEQRRTHIRKLADAIYAVMSSHGYLNVRSVGMEATYNATKSIAIACDLCREKNIELCFEVAFDEGDIGFPRDKGHVRSVTAMLFKLKDFSSNESRTD